MDKTFDYAGFRHEYIGGGLRRTDLEPDPIKQFNNWFAAAIKAGIHDANAMTLHVRGDIVTTTATEFRLLHYLAQHAGRVFTRDQILDAVWRETTFVSPRSVDVYVRKLREKIEQDAERPRYLKTVRGTGYRFEVPKS